MSFIYEALKRAEDDNQQRVTAAARSSVGSVVSRARSRWWVWALIGVLGANALVIGAWVLVRGPRLTREAVVAPRPEASTASVVASPRPEAPAPTAPTPPAPDVVAPAPRAPRAETAKPMSPIAPVREPRPERPPARATADARPERAPVVLPTPRAATPDVAAVKPTAPPVPAAPSAGAPKVNLQVLVYSDTPAQRMVFIDGRRYGEGDPIDGETVLERINADGIVVKHRGQRFVISERKP